MDRNGFVNIMNESLAFIEADQRLCEAVRSSIDGIRIFFEGEVLPPAGAGTGEGRGLVSNKGSATAVLESSFSDVAVLDFASARHPGGGARTGSRAQEESLCRVSTLLPVLESMKAAPFYHGHHDTMNSADIMLIPDVVFFRNENDFRFLPAEKWRKATVIVCAAPNLRPLGGWEGLDRTARARCAVELKERTARVFQAARLAGAGHLVLGAFGCGVFRNDPHVVAAAFKNTCPGGFDLVEYAIKAHDEEDANLKAFRKAFA